jgi:hypothetical protein
MAAPNTLPIMSRVAVIGWNTTDADVGLTAGPLKTANTARDGTGRVLTIFTADATNGGRVERVRARAVGTNVASVLRIFINNGASTATPANNILWAEVSLPATTLSEVAALANVEIPNAATVPDATGFPLVLPPGHRLTVAIGTTVAAGWMVTAVGGAY